MSPSPRRLCLRDLPPARPTTLGPWTTAASAAGFLLASAVGEALVLEDGRPLGVVTTRGLARVLARLGPRTAHLAARDVMAPVAVFPETAGLSTALRHLLATPSRRMAVVDGLGKAVGLLAPYHVAVALGRGDALAGRTVAQGMRHAVVTARGEESLPLVLGRMSRTGVGGVVVVDAEDRPRGVFTSRDAMRLLAAEEPIADRSVEACLRAPILTISPQLSLAEALAGMDGQGGGRLPVTDGAGQLLGVLTWTDVAAAVADVLDEAEADALREAATRYRDLYDNTSLGLFRLDLGGRPLAVNATLARLLGQPDPVSAVDQAWSAAQLFRLETPERRNLLVRALSGPEPVAFPIRVLGQDGTAARLQGVLRCVRDARGAPVCFEGVAWSEGDLPGLGDSHPLVAQQTEMVCHLDADLRLTWVNAAFARYWGTTPEACLSGSFAPDIPQDELALIMGRMARLSPRRRMTGFEHRVIRPDGRLRWQRWTCRAMFDASGELLGYQAVGRDVTGRKRAEERLRSQALFAQTLIEAMPAPVFYQDRQGLYRGCNTAFETLIGLPRREIIGLAVQDMHQGREAEAVAARDRELLRRGGRAVYETGLETAGGARHVIVRESVFRDEDGKADGIIGIVLDITERKRAEAAATKVRDDLEAGLARRAGELRQANQRLVAEVAERERIEGELRRSTLFLETVLNAIQDGICVLAPDMTVLKVNQAMRALYSESSPLEGHKCHEVYRGSEAPCPNCPSLRALATGKLAIGVVPKVEGGFETGWVELYCYPLFGEDGAVTGVVEIVRDVTARKKLEAELAVALERAESANQAKGAFLANMSHEIRTPLNAVLGYVQLMLRDRLEPSQRERLTVVEESATTLLSIINDILDYSKIEAGRLELKAEPFDLVRCLEAVVREQEVLARDKGLGLFLELAPDLPRTVRGDGPRLRQILRNLINNAVKYTDKGRVTVTALREEPGRPPDPRGRIRLRLAVADTGLGIPEDRQASLFDSFTQVDHGLTRCQAGTGLGLAICRRLAGLMGGEVAVRSRPGEGSVFWLSCPFEVVRATTAAGREPTVVTVTAELPPLRLLLVEDNRVNRVYAVELLTALGHQVAQAENGQAALDYLASHPVDLVLMDIQMPVMDGLTATRAIRAGQSGIDPRLPVVGLSAYALDQERERFLAGGLDDYITKPFGEGTFTQVARSVLARRGRLEPGRAATAPQPEALGLDTEGLARRYRDKRELLARVGREFMLSVPPQLDSLEASLAAGDMAVCERVAHTLKGNAAMFGAATMRELAARAERAAAAGDVDAVRDLAPGLAEACQAVLRHMEAFLLRLGG